MSVPDLSQDIGELRSLQSQIEEVAASMEPRRSRPARLLALVQRWREASLKWEADFRGLAILSFWRRRRLAASRRLEAARLRRSCARHDRRQGFGSR